MKYKLSYKKQQPDERNYVYISSQTQQQNNILLKNPQKSILCAKVNIPACYSIPATKLSTTILDQGSVGDCVCNAAAFTITSIIKTMKPSRLCLYALARILTDVKLSDDSGLNVIDACSAIKKYGVCQETAWPYIESTFSILPSLSAMKSCNTFNSFAYYFVNQDLQSIKQALVTNASPIIFGICVYDSFMTSQVTSTGMIPMPNTKTESLQGGHCLLLVGYNDSTQLFTAINSWGTDWGKKGYCYFPYKYLTDTNLAMDFCYYKINSGLNAAVSINTSVPVLLRLQQQQQQQQQQQKRVHPFFRMKFF